MTSGAHHPWVPSVSFGGRDAVRVPVSRFEPDGAPATVQFGARHEPRAPAPALTKRLPWRA